MENFTITGLPKLIFGAGKISELADNAENYGRNILLLTGGISLRKSGSYFRIVSILERFNIWEFSITGEPSPVMIDNIVKENINRKIDVVCAIGGGSVIDAGKAVSAMLQEKNFVTVKDYLEGVGVKEPSGLKIPFIAIPTTSGTGSESTKNAVISEIGNNGFKKSLRHDNYIPNIAIIDPELIIRCPASVTASSGLDALSQLLESYISNNANPFTDSLAKDAIIKILKALLPVCTEESDNIEYRSDLAYGAFISGITLAHAGLCTVHGIAGVIGGYKNIPHGLICGLLLPYWLEETVNSLVKDENLNYQIKIAKLASEIFPGIDDLKTLNKNFVQYIKNISDELQLPSLNTFNIIETDLELFALKGGNKNNAVTLTYEQKLNILRKAY